jgi:hypothetical protein
MSAHRCRKSSPHYSAKRAQPNLACKEPEGDRVKLSVSIPKVRSLELP